MSRESLRQWRVLEAVVARAAKLAEIDGVIVLGSFGGGEPDPLSDLDLLAVTSPGRFGEVWARRHELAGDALVTWDGRDEPGRQIRWFKWLTRDVVKVECGIVDATSGHRELAEPFLIAFGNATVADAFPRVSRATLDERAALRSEQQKDFDPADMTPGERIDWKLSELKSAVRDALSGR